MENITELNQFELISIDGGIEASFAYRVGEGIRFIGLSATLGVEAAYTMVYSWQ